MVGITCGQPPIEQGVSSLGSIAAARVEEVSERSTLEVAGEVVAEEIDNADVLAIGSAAGVGADEDPGLFPERRLAG